MDEQENGNDERAGAEDVGDEVALVREVVLRAHPDVVPELVSGATIAELLGSVEPARAAYARIAERQPAPVDRPPSVPAGAATVVVDPATLPSHELIRRGIQAGRRNGSSTRG